LRLDTSEFDQIVRFHFTQSIFDILLLSSVKLVLLYILISELERSCIQIAIYSFPIYSNAQINEINQSADEPVEVVASTSGTADNDLLIRETYVQITNNSFVYFFKRLFHFLILIICLISMIYSSVKFSLVLKLIIESQTTKSHRLPMEFYFFSIICTEFAFTLLELLFSLFSWKFMSKVISTILKQLISNESESDQKKNIDLKRLLSIMKPELGILFIGSIMLVISSISNIIVPYFFGIVVDSATRYSDLTEMNMFVIYMLSVLIAGSLASGFRSWLFELAGQRVVARLRQEGKYIHIYYCP